MPNRMDLWIRYCTVASNDFLAHFMGSPHGLFIFCKKSFFDSSFLWEEVAWLVCVLHSRSCFTYRPSSNLVPRPGVPGLPTVTQVAVRSSEISQLAVTSGSSPEATLFLTVGYHFAALEILSLSGI